MPLMHIPRSSLTAADLIQKSRLEPLLIASVTAPKKFLDRSAEIQIDRKAVDRDKDNEKAIYIRHSIRQLHVVGSHWDGPTRHGDA